jgi:hypothetical protein
MANFTELLDAIQGIVEQTEIRDTVAARVLAYEDTARNFTWQRSIRGGMIWPTFDVAASSRPFSTTFTGTDTQVVGAKELKLNKAKIEQPIDPDQYENQWLAFAESLALDSSDITGFAQYIIDFVIGVEAENNREQVLWQAEYDGAGTTSLDITDGFAKRISDAITATTLPAGQIEVTGVLDASNTYDAVHAVLAKVNRKYRKMTDMQVLVSEEVFSFYMEGWLTANPNRTPNYITSPVYNFGPTQQAATPAGGTGTRTTGLIMDFGLYAGIPLKVEDSMSEASSQRIVATPRGNLIVASNMMDMEDFKFRIYQKEWVFYLLAKYRLAMGIYEYGRGAIAVNDQA